MQIVDSIVALSKKTVTFKEETYFSELFLNLQELVMTTQNIVMSAFNNMDFIDFLSNSLQHYLELFGIQLDTPEQAIQLIRYE